MAGTRIWHDEQTFGGSKILEGKHSGLLDEIHDAYSLADDPSGTTHGRQTHLSMPTYGISLSLSLYVLCWLVRCGSSIVPPPAQRFAHESAPATGNVLQNLPARPCEF